jgi:phenylalanyl-tRNA synthetase beta chain
MATRGTVVAMRVPFSWLKEFIDTRLSIEEVAEALTLVGPEVEAIERIPLGFQGVVVGEVMATERHPTADKLLIAQVFDGAQTLSIVCGASNCRPGIKVALARVGAVLKAGGKEVKIKASKLRGIESQGMLCSAEELGVSGEGEGILELPWECETGRDLTHYYDDPVLHLGITPNLGHCASILGIARELAAITQESLTVAPTHPREEEPPLEISILLEDPGCSRYACKIIRGLKIGRSPGWLQHRLKVCGIRPVNNVVDITNYVMLELGEPLHAFDLNKLKGKEITVRKARPGESLTTLDGELRELGNEVLLICDRDGPVAAAGIMGGKATEVSDQTVDVLVEAAYFDPITIRRGSKQLRLQTEASRRFERRCDPLILTRALNRVADLMQQLAGGQVIKGIIDRSTSDFARHRIHLRMPQLNQLLGTRLSVGEIDGLLRRLGCEVTARGDALTVLVPSYRSDLKLEVDLIEEVGRLYGYANIARKAPTYKAATIPHTSLFLLERRVREELVGLGLQELVTCSLISPRMIQETLGPALGDPNSLIAVVNPASVEQSILRPSLLPNLVQVVKHNANQHCFDLAGFEVGRIHYRADQELAEQTEVGIILTGLSTTPQWGAAEREVDFFDLKGIVEALLERLGVDSVRFESSALPNFHPGRQARLSHQGRGIGLLGEVHPARCRLLNLRQPVLYAELQLSALIQLTRPPIRYTPLPQFPGSIRDWTIGLREEMQIQEFFEAVHQIPSRLLKNVAFRFIYRGGSVPEGWKNATFRFTYRDDRKTVSDETVEAEHERIVRQVETHLGERIRHES